MTVGTLVLCFFYILLNNNKAISSQHRKWFNNVAVSTDCKSCPAKIIKYSTLAVHFLQHCCTYEKILDLVICDLNITKK